MKKKTNIILSITFLAILFLIASFVKIYTPITCNLIMKSSIDSDRDFAQIFFDTGNDYNEKESVRISKKHEEDFSFFSFNLPGKKIYKIRIDPGIKKGKYLIKKICFVGRQSHCFSSVNFTHYFQPLHDISFFNIKNNVLSIETNGDDPSFEFSDNFVQIQNNICKIKRIWLYIGILCLYAFIVLLLNYFVSLDQRSQRLSSYLLIFSTFFVSILFALLTYDYIKLPYSNPWSISGPLTKIKYNPNNDIIRYLYIILMPVIGLLIVTSLTNIKKSIIGKWEPAINLPYILRMVSYILLLIFVIIYIGNSYMYHNDPSPLDSFHEGETLGMAIDYQNGKVPYKETIFVHGPLQDPLRSVFAFEIFGKSIAASRTLTALLEIVVHILFVLALYYLFDKNICFLAISLSLLILVQSLHSHGINFSIPSRDIPLYLFIITATMLSNKIKLDLPSGNIRLNILFFLWTFIPTIAFSYSIDRGFYLSFVALITLIIMYSFYWKTVRSYTFSISTGYMLGILIFGLSIKFAYIDFIKFSFLTMPKYKELMDGFIYKFTKLSYLIPVIMISVNIYWIFYKFICFKGNQNISFVMKLKKFYSLYFMEILLCLLSVTYFRSALGRSDLGHVFYVLAPVFISICFILVKHYLNSTLDKFKKYRQIILSTLTLIIVLISITVYYPHVRLNKLYTLPLGIPDNKIIPKSYIPVISYIRSHLNDNEYFFTMTNEASWYYFIDRLCPTKFPVVWFAMPLFYQDQVVRDLKNNNVKLVLYKNRHWANAIDGFTNQERLPRINNYIRNNYSPFKVINENELWIKNSK